MKWEISRVPVLMRFVLAEQVQSHLEGVEGMEGDQSS